MPPPRPAAQPLHHDVVVLALLRSGHDVDAIYSTLWPRAEDAPIPRSTFRDVVRALEVADATATPSEDLPGDLEDAASDLITARVKIMQHITSGGDVDEDGDFDAGAHMALCKNAAELLKYQSARQERQIHKLNIRVAQERARIELLSLYDERGGKN